jgi:predicted permease
MQIFGILQPSALPRVQDVRLDTGALVFTAAIGIVSGLLFGLAPALQLSRPDLADMLHDGGRANTTGTSRRALRKGLVVTQLTLSVILVAGAVLLTRSLIQLNRLDTGFDPSGVLTAQLQLPVRDYPRPETVVAFYRALTDRLQQIPGVEHAGAVRILPLTRTIGDWSITIEGRPFSARENPNGDFQVVTPGYFRAMGIRLIRGRLLEPEDREDSAMVVVINETMAERYWPGEDAIDKKFHLGTANQPWLTIVGIVGNVRHNAILEEPRAEMYLAHAQWPRETGSATRAMGVAVKTRTDPLAFVQSVRAAVRELDPNLPISDVRTMERIAANALSAQRFITVLLGSFAGLALALAAIGIYGTLSLLVTERAREIGIRVALGAPRPAIIRMVLSEGLAVSAVGLTLGLIGAASLAGVLRNLLYGVTTLDPVTFASTPAVLGIVALASCLIPALRAAALDPLETLRR